MGCRTACDTSSDADDAARGPAVDSPSGAGGGRRRAQPGGWRRGVDGDHPGGHHLRHIRCGCVVGSAPPLSSREARRACASRGGRVDLLHERVQNVGGLNTGEATPVSPAALTTTADGPKGSPAISASDASLEMTRDRDVQLEHEIGSGGFASVWLASYQVHAASPRGTDTLLASPLLCSPCMPRARRERRSPPSCSRTTRHAMPSRARPTCCASYATRASASSSV